MIRESRELEHKARRPDVLVDDEALFRFYEAHVPQGIHNGATFETWRTEPDRWTPSLVSRTREDLMRHAAAEVNEAQFPETEKLTDGELPLKSRFEPA